MNLKFEEIVEKLKLGEIETGLPEKQRRLWVKYCYHFSDIGNIISILSEGNLYSRNEAMAQGVMSNDNASQEVIRSTSSIFKDYVRFYFRPKTPTQYNNEGFRDKNSLSLLQAHCPLPVFLLFDIVQVLSMKNTKFSEVSLARNHHHQLMNTPEEFESLPFSMIYHDGWFMPSEREDIIAHRQAEIITTNQISLEPFLNVILVRSVAKMRTLLYFLPATAKQKYFNKIRIDRQKNAFFGRWTYFEEAVLTRLNVIVDVNCGEERAVFELKAKVLDHESEQIYVYSVSEWFSVPKLEFELPHEMNKYSIKIFLNEHIAFADEFIHRKEDELPF